MQAFDCDRSCWRRWETDALQYIVAPLSQPKLSLAENGNQ